MTHPTSSVSSPPTSNTNTNNDTLFVPTVRRFSCPDCTKTFTRKYDMQTHRKNFHSNNLPRPLSKCLVCKRVFESREELEHHLNSDHDMSEFILSEKAWDSVLNIFTLKVAFKGTPSALLPLVKAKCLKFIQYQITLKNVIRVAPILIAEMSTLHDDVIQKVDIPLRATRFIISQGNISALNFLLESRFQQLETRLDDFMLNGSGWSLEVLKFLQLEIQTTHSIPLNPKAKNLFEMRKENMSIGTFRSPNVGIRKKHLIIVKNNDDKCFLYAVAAHWLIKLVGKKKEILEDQNTYKKFISEHFILSGLTFPLNLTGISHFLSQNLHLNLKINLIGLDSNQKLFPLDCVGRGKREINILLYETTEMKFHAAYIKNTDKFLRAYYGPSVHGKGHTCPTCFQSFFSDKTHLEHIENCGNEEDKYEPKIILPEINNNKLKFKNGERKVRHPYTIYLDFETLHALEVIDKCKKCSVSRILCVCESSTIKLAILEPKCFSLVVIDQHSSVVFEKSYIGDDAADVAVKTIVDAGKLIKNVLNVYLPLSWTAENISQHAKAKSCYLCNDELVSTDYALRKVADHDHLTGNYLGAAHAACNLNRHDKKTTIPVYAHNMSGFDSSFLIRAMDHESIGKNVSCIGGESSVILFVRQLAITYRD